MRCTKCESENTQKLEVVYQSETSTTQSSGTIVGSSISDGQRSRGRAFISTSGTSQSLLGQKAAPPTQASYNIAGLMIFIGVMFFSQGLLFGLLGIPIIAAGIIQLGISFNYNLQKWPADYKQWQESWLCHQCGNIYRPE